MTRRGRVVAGAVPSCLLALSLIGGRTRAETIAESYREALQDYYEERYEAAAQKLERIAALPLRHEDLFYNLGCAYFRRGQLGQAIYNFERSLALDPEREDARFNLETARARVAARVKDVLKKVGSPPWWARLATLLEAPSWAGLFLGLWWLSLLLLLLVRRIAAGPARSGLIAAGVLSLLLALAGAAALAARQVHDTRVVHGIILPDRVEVKEGPSSASRTLFKVHAGLRVQWTSEESGWQRVRLANGLEGWIAKSDLGLL